MPSGRKKRGRPRIRWMKGIQVAMAERRIEEVQGWIQRNGNQELEDISDVNKLIHICKHYR
jgi:hypothetical protein